MSRLRHWLARVAFLGVGATQSGCCCPGDDPHIEADYDRSMPDVAALIDRCAANPDDCEPLCRRALADEFGARETEFWDVLQCDVTPNGAVTHVRVEYYDQSACGRAPAGLCAFDGDWIARAAYLEAASVAAFVHLAADLVRLGAPRALAIGAIAAAKDEVRHARAMRALARVPVPVPRVAPYRPLALRELAMLNAVEGCARETVGAAINLWQSRAARDPELRAVFAGIARDELAHAELAWEIHAWAMQQLDPTDRAAVLLAHACAFDRVLDEVAYDAELGVPARADVVAIFRGGTS